MVEISVIRASRLKDSWEVNTDENITVRQWLAYARYGAGFESIGEKLVMQTTNVNGNPLKINHIVLMYRRKNLNYIERIDIRALQQQQRYAKFEKYWSRIVRWIKSGEIAGDSDIVIYRTDKQMSERTYMNKYPIRMIDDTYAIITGTTYQYEVMNNAREISTDGEYIPIDSNVINYRLFMDTLVYDYNRNNFSLNDEKFRNRCYYLWSWLKSYKQQIVTILDSALGPDATSRGELVLWKDGKCLVKSEKYMNSDKPSDRLVGLEPDDLPRDLIDMPDIMTQIWIMNSGEDNL